MLGGVFAAMLAFAALAMAVPQFLFARHLKSLGTSIPETRWTMVNVSPNREQADCHLLEFPDGTKVLIDVADAADAPGTALAYLKMRKINRIDLVVISHFHRDHYGRLADLVKAGVQIGRVAINVPASRDLADRERPWGMDWEDVQSVLALLRDRRIPYFTPKAGERLVDITVGGVPVHLDTVCAFDGVHTPVGETDVNDTSIVLRLSHGKIRALFTGDLNGKIGAWLAANCPDLSADLLKIPHHGTEGCAPDSFYDRVQAKAAFVPGPRELWLSQRSQRIRTYFAEHGIPVYVSGIHGHVAVTMTENAFTVRAEGNSWPVR